MVVYLCARIAVQFARSRAASHPFGQRAPPLLVSPHCQQPQQRSRAADRTAAAAPPHCAAAAHNCAAATKMGFGAGDIKDKFRTYDGDADKRLRKKLEKSGKFDESFKTPVRIEKINVEVMGRWVAERLA